MVTLLSLRNFLYASWYSVELVQHCICIFIYIKPRFIGLCVRKISVAFVCQSFVNVLIIANINSRWNKRRNKTKHAT